MLDPHLLRDSPSWIEAQLGRRGFAFEKELFGGLIQKSGALRIEAERLRAERNQGAKTIGELKAKKQDASEELQAMQSLSLALGEKERVLSRAETQLFGAMLYLPNILDESVPDGVTEGDNRLEKLWGEPTHFDFIPKDHVDIGVGLGLELELAQQLSGGRFMVLKGQLALLHRALSQFMLNHHIAAGFEEFWLPVLVRPAALEGTGQLPKFEEDLYKTNHGDHHLYLSPTAETTLTSMLAGHVLEGDALPLKMTTHSACFRKEAGSYGRDVRGLIRQHQFEKVEMVIVAKPEESDAMLELMVSQAESVLEALDLPYRRMLLCSGDTGFSAAKTYDLEVYLPAQATYREISSCSNCRDFQARRLKLRYSQKEAKRNQLVHTLNGSGLAVGRTLVAVLENYQRADGSIEVPRVLQAYMGGLTQLTPHNKV